MPRSTPLSSKAGIAGVLSWPRATAVAVVAALALTACFGAGGGGDGSRDGGTTTTTGPRRGGVLRLGVQRLASLDPAQARTVDQTIVADQLFDGLTAYDAETLDAVPAIAREWTASEDQLQWDFFLRDDAAFSDGTPIVAADVKHTLERIARPGSGSPVADLLEAVTGYRPFSVDATAAELAGVTTPDEHTVHISLDQPLAVLPNVLANPAFGIVSRTASESTDPPFAEQPTGSGPFRIDTREGDRISLVPAVGVDALLDGIEILQYEDAAATYSAFASGDVDFVSQVPPEEVERAAEEYGEDGFQPYVAELFYGFNLKSPKFADIRFREAIVRAVDQESILKAVYAGTVLPLDGLIVQGIPGYQEGACGELCEFDQDRARTLLAEVFPDGAIPEINIDFDQEPTQEAVAKAIEANLEEVGIPVTLRGKPLKEYQEFAVSGNQEVFRLGWIAAYPSPDAFLAPLFLTGYPSNLTAFSDASVDEQLKAARAQPDASARLELYQAAERAIMAQIPVLPIAQFQLHSVTAARVRDLELTSFGTFAAAEVWLARRS